MKMSLVLAAALLATTPAFAYEANRSGRLACRNLPASHPQCARVVRADPFAVYSYDGRLIGRDPDPNVRMRLRDEDVFIRHR